MAGARGLFLKSLRSFVQLTELVEQLKGQLELDDVSDNPDDIAKVLTNLKHKGEATLDSIHTAIDEGQTIVEELKSTSGEGVDSSSLHHVQKVIKELDRVRRAIEHSWSRRRQQLELWLQLREFERAAKEVRVWISAYGPVSSYFPLSNRHSFDIVFQYPISCNGQTLLLTRDEISVSRLGHDGRAKLPCYRTVRNPLSRFL